jgi:hypothetical protein
MGTLPRGRWNRRVTSLVAAGLGAAAAAALVARRRAGARPVRPPPPTRPRNDVVPEARDTTAARPAQDPGAASPHVVDVGPAALATSPTMQDGPPTGEPVLPTEAHEPNSGPVGPAPGRNRSRLVAAGLGIVVAVTAGLGLFSAGRDDDPPDADVETSITTTVESTTTTVVGDLSPQDAYAQAAGRLLSGGSFGYVGTTSAIDVSHVRPGLWLAVDLAVEGEVVTSAASTHEIALDDRGRATETVSEGSVVWGRLATSREALPEAPYLPITDETGAQTAGKGVALLPAWLEATVDRQDAGTDERGNRVLRATLPASVLGEIVDGRPAADASVVLTLDATGDPVRVEVTSVPTGPPLRLALDLVRIGEPVTIDLPGEASP